MRSFIRRVVVRAGSGSRDAMVLRNIGASVVIKGASLLLGLLLLPAYLRLFQDSAALGTWFAVSGTLSWVLNFDFGFGNGLRNKLVPCVAKSDFVEARRYIASTYMATAAVVGVFGFLAWVILPHVAWGQLFNVGESVIANDLLTRAISILLLGLFLQLLLRTVLAVLYAMQRSAIPSFLALVTSASIFLYVSYAPSMPTGELLIALAWVHAVAAGLPLLVASFYLFGFSLKGYAPKFQDFRMGHARVVMELGLKFFAAQVAFMLLSNANPFLISVFSSPRDVVDFQIYSRPFAIVSGVYTLALTPIWSAVTEAAFLRDSSWIRLLYKRLIVLSVVGTVCAFVGALLLPTFVELWLGDSAIDIDIGVSLVFAASASVFFWNASLSSLANGLGILRLQIFALSGGAVLKVLFSWLTVSASQDWVWIVASDVVALLPYLVLQPILFSKLALFNTSRRRSVGQGSGAK